jgi:hypothetical protein
MNYSDKIAIQKTKADIVVGSYYKTRKRHRIKIGFKARKCSFHTS